MQEGNFKNYTIPCEFVIKLKQKAVIYFQERNLGLKELERFGCPGRNPDLPMR